MSAGSPQPRYSNLQLRVMSGVVLAAATGLTVAIAHALR